MMQPASGAGLKELAASGGRWTAMSAIASFVIQLSQFAILGRLMEPGDFGLMAMVMVIIGLVSLVADLGTTNFIVQTPTLHARQFGGAVILCAIASLVLAGSVALLSPVVAAYFRSPLLTVLLPATGLILVATALGQPFYAVLQRNMLFRAIAAAETVSGIAGMVAAVAVALAGKGVWALIAGQWVSSSAKAVICWVLSRSSLRPIWILSGSDVNAALRFGSFQMGERLFGYMALNIDKLIIGRLLGGELLGLYSVSYQIITKVMSIINPVFTRVALPLFSRIQDDNARLIRGYLQTVRTIALISFPVYLFLIIASDSIVHILLGPKWSNAAPIVSLLSGLGFVFTLSNPIGSLVLAKGRPGLAMLFTVAAVIVYGVSIYLGAFLGLTGAAIGFLFGAWGILFPAEFWLRWKLVGMRPFDYMTAIGRIGVVTLLCLLSAKGLVYFMTRNTKLAGVDLAIGIVAVTAYFTALWFSERELLQQTYRLIRQR